MKHLSVVIALLAQGPWLVAAPIDTEAPSDVEVESGLEEALDEPFIVEDGVGGLDLPTALQKIDYGDLPWTYRTLLVHNGARHRIDALFLGATVDAEPDGQPSPTALRDDNNGVLDDEDGIVFLTPIALGGFATIEVTASLPGYLDGFVDLNRDGNWDAFDYVIVSAFVPAGTSTLTFPVPMAAGIGPTFSRFRISATGGLGPAGPCEGGEVEDYRVQIVPPIWPGFGWDLIPVAIPGGGLALP